MRWSRANPLVSSLAAAMVLFVISVAIGATWAALGYRALARKERRSAAAERTARELADDLARREQAAAQAERRAAAEAERLRRVAETESAENRKRLVARLVSSGVEPLEQGDLLAALPWFAEALATDADHPVRAPMHRLRLATLLQQAPHLVQAAFLPATLAMPTLAPDGSTIVLAHDGNVTFVDLASGRRESIALDVPRPFDQFTLTPDGNFAACLVIQRPPGGSPPVSNITVWDVHHHRQVGPPVRSAGAIVRFAISSDGGRLAFVDPKRITLGLVTGSSTVSVYDTVSGQEAFGPIEAVGNVESLAFTAQSRRLVTLMIRMVGFEPQFFAQVWDGGAGCPLSPPLRHNAPPGSWEVSHDGSRLVTVTATQPSVQGEARVWDLTSGKVVAGPFHHGTTTTGMVFHAKLSPDGRLLATGGLVEIRLWNVASGTIAGRPLPHGPCSVDGFQRRWPAAGHQRWVGSGGAGLGRGDPDRDPTAVAARKRVVFP